MSIAKLKLDESAKLDFGVQITGADGRPDARFVIDGKDFSVSFPCKQTNEGVEVEIQGLSKIFAAGEYAARLEIVLENKIYTPLVDKIEFEPSVTIKTESKVLQVKESVKVAKVTVKKQEINEDQLRKTQAATIIAKSLGYVPSQTQTPKQIVNSALEQAGQLTNEQIATVQEMLALAEEVGIEYDKDLEPIIVEEVTVKPTVVQEEEDISEEEIDEMVESIKSLEDMYETYESGELCIADMDTGEIIDDLIEELSESEEINEVLSRAERIRAKVRFRKSEEKRERKLDVALHKHSDTKTINHRARSMAIKAMKMKIAKKPLDQLSVAEKERIEKIIAKRKTAINRLALKMVPRIKQIEKGRLAGSSNK